MKSVCRSGIFQFVFDLSYLLEIRNLFRRQIADLLPLFISKKPRYKRESLLSLSQCSNINFCSEFSDTEGQNSDEDFCNEFSDIERQYSDEESEQNFMIENTEKSFLLSHELVLASFLSTVTGIFRRWVTQNTSGKSLVSE